MNRKIFITRHTGALEWMQSKGCRGWEVRSHIDDAFIDTLNEGDLVAGILPIALIGKVQARTKAWFYSLELGKIIPADLRGKELSKDQLNKLGASLVPISINFHTEGVIK